MTVSMTTEEKIAHMDTRLTLIEQKVTTIDSKVDTRFDEVMTVLGVSPNAALGTVGTGLAGSVSALLAAEEARKMAERDRERRQVEDDRRRKWVIAVISLLVTVAGTVNIAGLLRH